MARPCGRPTELRRRGGFGHQLLHVSTQDVEPFPPLREAVLVLVPMVKEGQDLGGRAEFFGVEDRSVHFF